MARPIGTIRRRRRGLTLLELLLALSISALVAGSLVAMLDAVAVGTTRRGDIRSTLVAAGGINTRLNAYITPARAFLDVSETEFVLWFHDDRTSETVHATEIRWFQFDATTGELLVQWIAFPDTWTQVARDLADSEFRSTSDWDQVRLRYDNQGHLMEAPVAEGLTGVAIGVPVDVSTTERISIEISFDTSATPITLSPAFIIDSHQEPSA